MTVITRHLDRLRSGPNSIKRAWLLPAIVLTGLAARLAWILVFQPIPKLEGGDGPFYIEVAQSVVNGTGFSVCDSLGCYTDLSLRKPVVTIGPVYPLFLAAFYAVFPDGEKALQASRLADAFLSALTILAVYWLTCRLFHRTAGLLAAAIMAFDLRFVLEIGNAHTETLFTLLLMLATGAAIWARTRAHPRAWLVPGILFGVASLTRAITLLMPALVLAYLLLNVPARTAFRSWSWFGVAFALTVSPWLVRNLALGNGTLAEGGAAHFWLGTQRGGRWEGQEAFNQAIEEIPRAPAAADNEPTEMASPAPQLVEQPGQVIPTPDSQAVVEDSTGELPPTEPIPGRGDYLRAGLTTIVKSPLRYLALLIEKPLRAYVQPSGTVPLGGESVKTTFLRWLHGESTFREIIGIPTFLPKLYIYVFHFGTIGTALVAMARHRKKWRLWLLPAAIIVYFSALYSLLTIIPRYIFPIMPLYIVLATLPLHRETQRS